MCAWRSMTRRVLVCTRLDCWTLNGLSREQSHSCAANRPIQRDANTTAIINSACVHSQCGKHTEFVCVCALARCPTLVGTVFKDMFEPPTHCTRLQLLLGPFLSTLDGSCCLVMIIPIVSLASTPARTPASRGVLAVVEVLPGLRLFALEMPSMQNCAAAYFVNC